MVDKLRRIIFLLAILYFGQAYSHEKVCLNMIVKNESHVIERALTSAKPLIDYWVIVDTGSTDGTQEIIKEFMKDIPGELYERPWKNFGYNRTEALELAKPKGGYILFLDADDHFEYPPGYKFPELTKDVYRIWSGTDDLTYPMPQLIKASLPSKWVGVTHEYLDCAGAITAETLSNFKRVTGHDGARSRDPRKFMENVEMLKEGLKEEPDNVRYVFYIAESYKDAGRPAEALEWYQKRIAMGDWPEEVFWSKLQSAHILSTLGLPPACVIEAYKAAHEYKPNRIEPYYFIAECYNKANNYNSAYCCLKSRIILSEPFEKGDLFNLEWIHEFGYLCQLSIAAYHMGFYQECLDICNFLLEKTKLSPSWLQATEHNRHCALDRLKEM